MSSFRKRQANNIAFNESFPSQNYQSINKLKAEKALAIAKKQTKEKENNGMRWIKDPATKSKKLVRINESPIQA